MITFPCSPRDSINGLPYFKRLCHKVRLHQAQKLDPAYHSNLGKAMDLWTCQFLGVSYSDLKATIEAGANDEEALQWAKEHGVSRSEEEQNWWISYMMNCGFRDHLSERLEQRKQESGFSDRKDICTFMDYIDADEQRL